MKKLTTPWGLSILSILLYIASNAILLIISVNNILKIPEPKIITKEAQIAKVFDLNSNEIKNLIKELKSEKEKLKNREKDLLELRKQIAQEKEALLLVKNEIENLKDRVSATIYQINESEKKNFDDLVSFYSQLGSENALKIINQFDDLYLAKLLYLMDIDTKLQFFEKITQQSPARAKKLLEMLRKFIPTEKVS